MIRHLGGFFTLLMPLLSSAATSANFLDYRDYLLRGTPQAVAIADVNGDGIPDAVIASYSGTAVMLGLGNGSFAPPTYVGNTSVLAVAVADFNNDGKPDIVATILTNGASLTLALGNGDGTFQTPQGLPIPCIDCYVAAADFNGDGKMDLAVASTGVVSVFLGNGSGGFSGGPPAYLTQFAVDVRAGDANGDGKPDLLVCDSGAGVVSVLLGNGDGSFQRTDYPSGTQPEQAALGDFNGDGLADLAAVDRGSGSVLIWLNQGNGVFGPSTPFAANCGCTLEGLAVGDFNRDGKLDIATPGSLLHGNGDGTFQAAVKYSAGADAARVGGGDFNHDGYADLLVCNLGATTVSVLLGDPKSVLQPGILAAGVRPKAVAVGDFNGDGKPDLAVAAMGDNQVHILLGAGQGAFTPGVSLPATQPGAVIARDFNHDGKVDLAISSGYGTWIYLGNGDGTFGAGTQYTLYGDCTNAVVGVVASPCFASADFNGDGIPDLAGASYLLGTVTILLGNGDGSFRTAPPSSWTYDLIQGLAAGDFNHDGKMDLALSSYYGSIYVYPGNGDGTFGPAVTLSIGGTGAGLAVGDVNGDGHPDIVVAGGESQSLISLAVFVITGNGNMTFNAPIPLAADADPNSVVLGDFNNDGRLDIASANFSAGDITVLINKGNLTFAPEALYGAAGGTAVIVAADLNGDGKKDLVAVDEYAGALSVLLHARR